jgi:F-type H+-transporting ATPase subunit a
MLLGWLVSLLLVLVFIAAAKRIKINSAHGSATLVEIACEGIANLADQVMHNRQKAIKYAPFLITLFCFILLNNWAGLLPGVGSLKYNGVPLFRAWTSDLTGTLALSISSIIIIQIYTIKELKIRGYLKHYFSDKPWNPINLFVGFLEVLGEFTRIASLALRLFGNIFAGEVLLVVLSAITGFGSPATTLPFIFMELFVGFIQAFVFTMLVIVYLTLATSQHDENSDEESDHSVQANKTAQTAVSPSSG